jgi:hypothetical protein
MTTTRSAPPDQAPGAMSLGSNRSPHGAAMRSGNDHGAHLLRLVLDLQLDALLLGLGAAAVEASHTPTSAPPAVAQSPGSAPWPRWAVEDIDLARTLAAEAVHSGAALPATLGPEPAGQEQEVVLRRLAARYESMRDLLADLVARADRNAPEPGRTYVQRLMAHCQNRLLELRDLTRTARIETKPAHPSERAFLPGELLG